MTNVPFDSYHAHLYFPVGDTSKVELLLKKIKDNFDLKIGTVHNKPVGPHPIGSCQILLSQSEFSTIIPWLAKNRDDIDVFIHPCSGDDLKDHTDFVMWLGKSYELNLEIFKAS